MAEFLKDLDWRSHPDDFTEDERRILMTLSQERWSWVTINALRLSTRLPEPEFGDALASLMSDGLVRGGRSDDWRAIFGLTERVGEGVRPVRDRRKAVAG